VLKQSVGERMEDLREGCVAERLRPCRFDQRQRERLACQCEMAAAVQVKSDLIHRAHVRRYQLGIVARP
jgi:hypothetical protein